MGEYAEIAWQRAAIRGMRVNPNYVPRKRPRVACPVCAKMVEKTEGLKMHTKAKHPPLSNRK